MLKRLFKWVYKTLEFLIGFIIILLIMLVVRLWIEPLQIKHIHSLIDSLVPKDSEVKVDVSDAYVELALAHGHLLDIRLDKVSAKDNTSFLLNVENVKVTFNPLFLLVGKVVVRDVILQEPYVQLNLTQGENDTIESKKRPLERKINRVRRHFENLDLLEIQDGNFVLNLDENKQVNVSDVDLLFDREDENINMSAIGKLYFDTTHINLDVKGVYNTDEKIASLTMNVKEVELQKFQNLIPTLNGMDLVLDGQAEFKLDLKKLQTGWLNIFEDSSFMLKSDKIGSVYLPKPLDTAYTIEGFVIEGGVSPSLKQAFIKDAKIKILGQEALVSATLNNLDGFIQTKDFNQTNAVLDASLHNIPLVKVPALWPAYLGTDAHDWIKQNVVDGNITKATLNLKMQGVEIDDLTSVLDIENAKVIYLDTMAPVEKAKAQVVLKPTHIDINVLDGVCNGVSATGGFVNFLDLDKDIPSFDAHVQLSGNIKNALEIVSPEPLDVCADIPFVCEGAIGDVKGELQLAFPFSDNLTDEIKFSISADLENTEIPLPKTDWTFRNGNIKLFINNQKLSLKGHGLLDDKLLQMDIFQSLDKKTDASYEFRVPVSPSMIAPYFANIDDFLKGNLLADIIIEPKEQEALTVSLDFGLKDAEISLPIGYIKEFNRDGTLKATLQFKGDELKDIPSVYLSIPEEKITLKGQIKLPKNKLFELDLTEIKAPQTDAKLTLGIYKNGSFDAIITGKELQIKDLLHGDYFNHQRTEEEAKKQQLKKPSDFLVIAKLDKLYLSDEEPFTKVDVVFKKKNGHWVELQGSFVSLVPFTFSLNADKTALHLATQDVGVFLKRAGYTDRISGGVLDTTLSQEDDGSLKGEILINDFKLTKTSFFMQAATLLGIVDAFSGDYISFTKAVIPFVLSPTNVVTIEDAVASGTAVGVTLRGEVSPDKIALDGSVVPAYALNSLFGKIPLVGTILAGEKGGGLFGITYSVTGTPAQKEFKFNPASLLAPGIFRRLF